MACQGQQPSVLQPVRKAIKKLTDLISILPFQDKVLTLTAGFSSLTAAVLYS